jgi:hypothetical protein
LYGPLAEIVKQPALTVKREHNHKYPWLRYGNYLFKHAFVAAMQRFAGK